MVELSAAYEANDELKQTLRRVRGELEVLASYGDPADEAPAVRCMDLIDEALSDLVRA